MPHITFIYPSVGRFSGTKYVRSWQMQPLAIAALSYLTPASWGRRFFDDRLEPIDFNADTDIVAISIETFTAKRGYQIAEAYRRKGVPVVMGGYHATFCPEEALEHANAVCIGEAEGVWLEILDDFSKNKLKDKYQSLGLNNGFTDFDRSIFAGKNYFKIDLVETGRGCHFKCNFCSITSFHQGKCRYRPIKKVVDEIQGLPSKTIFIVDDNMAGDLNRAKELFSSLCNLGIQWVGQASINITQDEEVVDLMVRSGCVGLLIGFESMNQGSLACIGKKVNQNIDYGAALDVLRKKGIVIYGTFMIGLPCDSFDTVHDAVVFAVKEKIFIAAFNHVVPFPGTPLYTELEEAGRLSYTKWWMSEKYRFGDAPFDPECSTADVLQQWCDMTRRKFYSVTSILKRSTDLKANCGTLRKAGLFFSLNYLLRREISQKKGIPLGCHD